MEKAHPQVKTLRDVTEAMAETYAAALQKSGMAAATYNAHIGLLRLVWRVLRKKAKTVQNPWIDVGRKRVSGAGRRELTVAELKAVCGKATGEMRLLFALGCYTGLRLGDCATLRWAETDIERRLIRRIPMKTARRNPHPVLVPLHAVLVGMLTEIPPEHRREYVLPETATRYLRDGSTLCKAVQEHYAACGVRTQKIGTGFITEIGKDGKAHGVHTGKRAVVEVGFHSLRHTFVSLCREANAPLAVVEAIVGHSNPAMTRHYTHVSETAAAAAVNSLPAVLGDAPPALPPADALAVFTAKVRELTGGMTPKTWRAMRSELLALTETKTAAAKA
jgi:integrase